jgi:HD-like signal output (HDOD) protein
MNHLKPDHYENLLRSSNETTSSPVSMESPQPESAVVTELLAAFSNPDLDLDHIVELIACEPTLSTEILRRSNSVRFGGKAPATDIFAAISRIGISEAQSALVALRA